MTIEAPPRFFTLQDPRTLLQVGIGILGAASMAAAEWLNPCKDDEWQRAAMLATFVSVAAITAIASLHRETEGERVFRVDPTADPSPISQSFLSGNPLETAVRASSNLPEASQSWKTLATGMIRDQVSFYSPVPTIFMGALSALGPVTRLALQVRCVVEDKDLLPYMIALDGLAICCGAAAAGIKLWSDRQVNQLRRSEDYNLAGFIGTLRMRPTDQTLEGAFTTYLRRPGGDAYFSRFLTALGILLTEKKEVWKETVRA